MYISVYLQDVPFSLRSCMSVTQLVLQDLNANIMYIHPINKCLQIFDRINLAKSFFNWKVIFEDIKGTANAVFSSFENVGNLMYQLDVLMAPRNVDW
jgi:hypothetical protein